MEIVDHIVEFDKYCKTCKHKEVRDDLGFDPCHDCLNHPTNTNSKKPVNYVEDEKLKKEEAKKNEKTN